MGVATDEDVFKWVRAREMVFKHKPLRNPIERFATTKILLKCEAKSLWEVKEHQAIRKMAETGKKQDDGKPVLSERGYTMEAFSICNREFVKSIFKPPAAHDQRKYMRIIIVTTSKLPVKT